MTKKKDEKELPTAVIGSEELLVLYNFGSCLLHFDLECYRLHSEALKKVQRVLKVPVFDHGEQIFTPLTILYVRTRM